jgi:hypothetical protein
MSTAAKLIDQWLETRLSSDAHRWLTERCNQIAAGDSRTLFTAFSAASRQVGKDDARLAHAELSAADAAVPAWNPSAWTIDQLARARLILAFPSIDARAWLADLDRMFACADLGELVALYQCLPLLQHPELLRARAAEGIRTNIKAVFEAVALDNPYPVKYLDEGAWNQLVLKALFIGSPLHRIIGIDERANPRLTRMLCDFAHERWAAKRDVDPELWRPVGICPDAGALDDLRRVLKAGNPVEQRAAALALAGSAAPEAQELIARHGGLQSMLGSVNFSWDELRRLPTDPNPFSPTQEG